MTSMRKDGRSCDVCDLLQCLAVGGDAGERGGEEGVLMELEEQGLSGERVRGGEGGMSWWL